MAFNPSKQQDPLASPASSRKNSVNDPGYDNKVGYYPYQLGHVEVTAPLYGLITPTFHLITAMGDRHVMNDDVKLLLNRINGNFLNTLNYYTDTFFVSNHTLFPNNWDKLIPNPVKGDDLPHSARPVVPLYSYFRSFVIDDIQFELRDRSDENYSVTNTEITIFLRDLKNLLDGGDFDGHEFYYESYQNSVFSSYAFGNLHFLATILSRGQLLDYLGIQFDFSVIGEYKDTFQYLIDKWFDSYYNFIVKFRSPMYRSTLNPIDRAISILNPNSQGIDIKDPSDFRDLYLQSFEDGKFLYVDFYDKIIDSDVLPSFETLVNDTITLIDSIEFLFDFEPLSISEVDAIDNFNGDGSLLNLSKVLAYQLSVAQYFTNDNVDNIFTSDLYMQLLRAVMYPSADGFSSEPTFDYNGVPTEYDYISYGGFYSSFFLDRVGGAVSRRFLFGSMMFMLRRSLRYGDKFATGRKRMLAVGSEGNYIPVDGDVSVNPVNVVLSLVTQRYLNVANRVGNKPLDYYASVMGVVPTDLPSIPRYVSHRRIEIENRIISNTANDQGAQVTNMVGYRADDTGFDVFIDDYGILLTVGSFDTLPIYSSGIDSENFISDRFEYFNPMMQNIGDQPIRRTEFVGVPYGYGDVFAYTVRNAEYKYKTSRAHGVLCYNMPGYLMKFPTNFFQRFGSEVSWHVDPDFIRDKPSMLDSVITHALGTSPGTYWHFIVSSNNQLQSSRMIQRAPSVLF